MFLVKAHQNNSFKVGNLKCGHAVAGQKVNLFSSKARLVDFPWFSKLYESARQFFRPTCHVSSQLLLPLGNQKGDGKSTSSNFDTGGCFHLQIFINILRAESLNFELLTICRAKPPSPPEVETKPPLKAF